MDFLYPFLQRILSGLQSMFGYDKAKSGFIVLSLVMLLFPLITLKFSWLFLAYFITNLITVYMKTASFDILPLTPLKKYRDIHLWENLVTGGYVVYLIFAHFNILLIMCSVYPALILHKGFINIGSGLKFFATATDDPTGETYGFKLFGLKIKRSSNLIRLILAGVSLIAAGLILFFGWNLSI